MRLPDEVVRVLGARRADTSATTIATSPARRVGVAVLTIGVATLVVCGDVDERSPLSVGRELHSAIPGSTLAVLSGLGHECYLESADTLGAEVRRFLLGQALGR